MLLLKAIFFKFNSLVLIGNRTSFHSILAVILLVINKSDRLPLGGRPMLLISCVITERVGLNSILNSIIFLRIVKQIQGTKLYRVQKKKTKTKTKKQRNERRNRSGLVVKANLFF